MKSITKSVFFSLMIAGAAVCVAPSAWAQDEDVEDTEDTEDTEEPDADEPDADEPDGDEPVADEPAPAKPKGEAGWGVGGKEPNARFGPESENKKLKALDDKADRKKEQNKPLPPPPAGFANVDVAIGFGSILMPTSGDGRTEVSPTASFVIGAGYRFADMHHLAIRFPVSTGVNNGPVTPFQTDARDPDAFTRIAIGNGELAYSVHIPLSPHIKLPAGLAITVPTGSGDVWAIPDARAEYGEAVVNAAAAASRGWEDRALFAQGRLGITPRFGFMYSRRLGPGGFHFAADTKAEIMIKVVGNDPPPVEDLAPGEAQGASNGVSVNWVTQVSSFYDLFDGLLSPGLRLWFAYSTSDDTKGSIAPGGAQFVIEPRVRTHIHFIKDTFGMDAHVGYMIPGGGELGGSTNSGASIGGLRLGAGIWF